MKRIEVLEKGQRGIYNRRYPDATSRTRFHLKFCLSNRTDGVLPSRAGTGEANGFGAHEFE